MIFDMKRKTIRNHNDFLTPRDGIFARAECFIVRTKLAKYPENPRYGIIVTKRNFKLAVQRNRAKRLLRDWIANSEHLMIDDFDYVFIVNDKVFDATRDQGRKFMAKVLKKIARMYKFKNEKK